MTHVLKKELILSAAQDIVEYLDEKFAVEVDPLDIAELINLNIRDVFNTDYYFIGAKRQNNE